MDARNVKWSKGAKDVDVPHLGWTFKVSDYAHLYHARSATIGQ